MVFVDIISSLAMLTLTYLIYESKCYFSNDRYCSGYGALGNLVVVTSSCVLLWGQVSRIMTGVMTGFRTRIDTPLHELVVS
jgi:hypothetical protein